MGQAYEIFLKIIIFIMKTCFLLCCNGVLNFRKKIETGLNSFGAQMKKL
jgi:hypothetical protein